MVLGRCFGGAARSLAVSFVAWFVAWFVASCAKEVATDPKPPPPAPAAAPVADAGVIVKRPKLPGDFEAGWRLFREHCLECHGEGRRGGLVRKDGELLAPADLRDPLLLVSKSDKDLVGIMTNGLSVKKGGKSKKGMPSFKKDLDERQMLDVVSFLRGDSIHLVECVPDATHFVHLNAADPEPPILGAYKAGAPGSPAVVTAADVPAGAEALGHVMFFELDLPQAGPTPVALVATSAGVSSRVALPEPDNANAARDLDSVIQGKASPLAALGPLVSEAKRRIEAAAKIGTK